jgi:hypothetical protein
LSKCKQEHRDALIIKGAKSYDAIVILAPKNNDRLKISTFKVADLAFMKGYGDLLIRAILEYSHKHSFALIYLTVYPNHSSLIKLMSRYGFKQTGTKGDEIILSKEIK